MEEYKKETGELPMLWGRSGYADLIGFRLPGQAIPPVR